MLDTRTATIEVAPVFAPLERPARFKGTFGGRGTGKSWFWAGQTVEWLLSGLKVLCIREVQNSIADSVKRLIEDRIGELELEDYFEITEKEIRCPASGGLAIFRGMQNHTAASVKSLEGFDRAWWEEAQTASQHSLDLLIPTIRKPGSELCFSWNPDNETAPIEFLRRDPPEGSIVLRVSHTDNPWFPAELRADMERDRQREPDKAAWIWDGEYRGSSEARVFRNFRAGELAPPDNVFWFYGLDFGFAVDPTAAVRFCIMGDVLYIDHEAYETGTPTESLPAFLAQIPDANKWPMRADSARPETIDYLRRHGFPKIRAAKKGKGSIEDGITFLQSMDIVVHPRCANTLREFRTYAYKTDPRTEEVLPVILDRNNHAIDALRYGAEGLHRRGKLIQATQTEERKRRDYGMDEDEEATNWKTL